MTPRKHFPILCVLCAFVVTFQTAFQRYTLGKKTRTVTGAGVVGGVGSVGVGVASGAVWSSTRSILTAMSLASAVGNGSVSTPEAASVCVRITGSL